MNVFDSFLDERDEAKGHGGRESELLAWISRQTPAEVRLLKFDSWLRGKLAERLDWTWAGDLKARRIEQARLYLERMVLDLWKRGWMLDGRHLAGRILTLLDAVAEYQKAGKIRSFWPYFCATVDRYVGLNSEELQADAMRVGSTVEQLLGPLGIKRHSQAPTLPELVAARADEVTKAKGETLRSKQARERARLAACKAKAAEAQLFV